MRKRWVISGTVQGVGFRAWVAKRGTGLGLRGWVRNLADGSVEVEAEGDDTSMVTMDRLLRSGPASSRVRDVTVHAATDGVLAGFIVRRD
jgi:acylphosphatase